MQRGMFEMSTGNVGMGAIDMMMGQREMQMGNMQMNRGMMEANMGMNQMNVGMMQMNMGNQMNYDMGMGGMGMGMGMGMGGMGYPPFWSKCSISKAFIFSINSDQYSFTIVIVSFGINVRLLKNFAFVCNKHFFHLAINFFSVLSLTM